VRGLATLAAALAALTAAGCGGSEGASSSGEYPLVEEKPVARQAPVTLPEGSVVTLPALPTVYETDPSPTCERVLATFHGANPTRKPIVIPPMPGLQAVAVTTHTTRIEWSFRDLPDDCRPDSILVSVKDGSNPRATPTTEQIPVEGSTGSAEVTYPDFLTPPNVALASAVTRDGVRGRTASVLIRQAAR
jgi:hypothetical protein